MRQREVRALFNTDTITVYQAYSHEIADRALEAGIFVPPFKPGRMTWIKPSFLWMMHRSGWATKPNQERILAIEISREGFMWSLTHSCLSSYAANLFPSYETWRSQLTAAPVRIQWDPDRDLHMQPQSERSIQIGLGIEASRLYVNNWINRIRDVTHLAHNIHALLRIENAEAARKMIPIERGYPLTSDLARRIGANTPTDIFYP